MKTIFSFSLFLYTWMYLDSRFRKKRPLRNWIDRNERVICHRVSKTWTNIRRLDRIDLCIWRSMIWNDEDNSKSKFRGVLFCWISRGRKSVWKIENVRDRTRSVRHNSVVRYQEVRRLTARRESHANITTLVRFYCSTRKLYRSYV